MSGDDASRRPRDQPVPLLEGDLRLRRAQPALASDDRSFRTGRYRQQTSELQHSTLCNRSAFYKAAAQQIKLPGHDRERSDPRDQRATAYH